MRCPRCTARSTTACLLPSTARLCACAGGSVSRLVSATAHEAAAAGCRALAGALPASSCDGGVREPAGALRCCMLGTYVVRAALGVCSRKDRRNREPPKRPGFFGNAGGGQARCALSGSGGSWVVWGASGAVQATPNAQTTVARVWGAVWEAWHGEGRRLWQRKRTPAHQLPTEKHLSIGSGHVLPFIWC